jgi:FkbM family methyltransferase
MKLKNHLSDVFYNPLLKIYNKFINRHWQKSYSQEGEDLILYRLIYGKIEKGFYVDVGAHHPKRFSNTYFFYKKGWQGINIEPMPGSKYLFNLYRPRDINLEIPISSKEEILTYYIFNDPALNGFLNKNLQNTLESRGYKIIKTVKLKTRTLRDVLYEHMPAGKKINLLNIDVEGLDMDVLQSNDWQKFKPEIILIEDRDFRLDNPKESAIYNFLSVKNYALIAKCLNTLIFKII